MWRPNIGTADALVRSRAKHAQVSGNKEPRLLFALRAQCGRGRPRSQCLVSQSFQRERKPMAHAVATVLAPLSGWP